MKKSVSLLLALLVLFLSACGSRPAPSGAISEAPISGEPAPTATPTPDFSGTDFSGRWYVDQIIDSNGVPVSDAEKQNLGGDFTIELLPTGAYFVYGGDGKAMGQGAYSVSSNALTLTAQGQSTVYEIVDADTLRIVEPDASITVMKREATEPADVDGDAAGEDLGDAEIDIPEGGETATPETPSETPSEMPSETPSETPSASAG